MEYLRNMYFFMVSSSDPTVLTQYPRDYNEKETAFGRFASSMDEVVQYANSKGKGQSGRARIKPKAFRSENTPKIYSSTRGGYDLSFCFPL